MKGTRLTIFILSIFLLTLTSGLLFYKNLFQLESPDQGKEINVEELRMTDLQLDASTAILRKNINSDPTTLSTQIIRLKDLIDISTDTKKSSNDLQNSLQKINSYFNLKLANLKKFQLAIVDLKTSLNSLSAAYNELNKFNIKFVVDKKDFYRECVVDSLFFFSLPSKDNEEKLIEDEKIIEQILGFASIPNPHIKNFNKHVTTIHKKTNELEVLMGSFYNENPVKQELTFAEQYYKELQVSQDHDSKVFLNIIFTAIILYLVLVIVLFRKLILA